MPDPAPVPRISDAGIALFMEEVKELINLSYLSHERKAALVDILANKVTLEAQTDPGA